MKKYLFAILFLAAASSAWAGTSWISSGGGSFKDEHNPWFVRNTTNVNYCIAIDQATFSVPIDQVRQALEGAIAYWKAEFSSSQGVSSPGGLVVASQTFTEVDCSTQPELQILAGYGTLTPDQVSFFTDSNDPVTDYISVTVRTDYDPVQLKGRGFIYLSSDLGANVYQNDGNLIAPAWNKPNLLQYSLIHEMGHVFGFPHLGTGIMSEVFLEQMLDSSLTYIFQNYPIEHFLFPGPTVESCSLLPNMLSWFQAPAGTGCIQLQLGPQLSANIPVLARPNTSASPTPIGTLMGVNISALTDLRTEPGIFLHITSVEKVFTQQEANFKSFILGPNFIDYGAQANYVPLSGAPLSPVYFRLTSTSFTLLGNQSGKIGTVFSYDSPIDLLLVQH